MKKQWPVLLICLAAGACKDPVQEERHRIRKEFDSINNSLIQSNKAARTENEKLLDALDSLERAQR